MNDLQKKLFLGVIIINSFMGLFPPWQIKIRTETKFKGYDFIAHPPHDYATINITTLLVQVAIVTLCGAALMFYFKDIKKLER